MRRSITHLLSTLTLLAVPVGCRDATPRTSDKKPSPPTQSQTNLVWTQKMSNALLQRWVGLCGKPTNAPASNERGITVWLGDDQRGTACMFTYTQATMLLQDVQITVTSKDAASAQDTFVQLTNDTVVPLLPSNMRNVVVTDISKRQTYKNKTFGPFFAAMRDEVQGEGTIRWLWIHFEAPIPGRNQP